MRLSARTTSTQSMQDPSYGFIRALRLYLDIVGQLGGHQVVELLLTQGARGPILPGVRLELGDKGADGSLHDGVCALRPWKQINTQTGESNQKLETASQSNWRGRGLICCDALRCVLTGNRSCIPLTLTITSPQMCLYVRSVFAQKKHGSAENT